MLACMYVCMYVLFLKVYLLLNTFHSLFSTENRLLSTPWTELQNHLSRTNRVVHRIAGNGFCFLNAVAKSLEADHDISIKISEAINIINQHLIDNHEKYVRFHRYQHQKQDLITNSDSLVNEAMHVLSEQKLQH